MEQFNLRERREHKESWLLGRRARSSSGGSSSSPKRGDRFWYGDLPNRDGPFESVYVAPIRDRSVSEGVGLIACLDGLTRRGIPGTQTKGGTEHSRFKGLPPRIWFKDSLTGSKEIKRARIGSVHAGIPLSRRQLDDGL